MNHSYLTIVRALPLNVTLPAYLSTHWLCISKEGEKGAWFKSQVEQLEEDSSGQPHPSVSSLLKKLGILDPLLGEPRKDEEPFSGSSSSSFLA